jgi:site-specific DNA recombinase
MTPTHATKGGKRYRYYLCSSALSQGRECPSRSVPAGPLERIVMEQISKWGQDPKRLTAILEEASKQRRTRLLELEAEGRGVEQELGRAQAVLQNLLQETGPGNPKQPRASEFGVLRENIGHLERRFAEIKNQTLALQRTLEMEQAARALSALEQEFGSLPTIEQARLIRLMIQRVEYDGGKNKITLTLDPAGLATVVEKLTKEDEGATL